jgi:hypothetical protein
MLGPVIRAVDRKMRQTAGFEMSPLKDPEAVSVINTFVGFLRKTCLSARYGTYKIKKYYKIILIFIATGFRSSG